MHKPQYIQIPAEFLSRLSEQERTTLAMYLRLKIRFQWGFIHGDLDARTCKKAGMSKRNLQRYIKRLCKPEDESLLRNLAVDLSKVRWERLKGDDKDVYVAIGRANKRGWMIGSFEILRHRIELFLAEKPCMARSTVKIDAGMDIHQIRAELTKKVFEHHQAQVVGSQCEVRRNSRKVVPFNGKEAFNVEKQYAVHPATTILEPVVKMHQAQLPSKAFSEKMGISRRTFWRYVSLWEAKGSIERKRRRILLDGPPDDVKAFHKQWGAMPFQAGGLWYAQLPNLYSVKEDYRGPNCTLRSDTKGYGRSLTSIITGE